MDAAPRPSDPPANFLRSPRASLSTHTATARRGTSSLRAMTPTLKRIIRAKKNIIVSQDKRFRIFAEASETKMLAWGWRGPTCQAPSCGRGRPDLASPSSSPPGLRFRSRAKLRQRKRGTQHLCATASAVHVCLSVCLVVEVDWWSAPLRPPAATSHAYDLIGRSWRDFMFLILL